MILGGFLDLSELSSPHLQNEVQDSYLGTSSCGQGAVSSWERLRLSLCLCSKAAPPPSPARPLSCVFFLTMRLQRSSLGIVRELRVMMTPNLTRWHHNEQSFFTNWTHPILPKVFRRNCCYFRIWKMKPVASIMARRK